MNNTLEVHWLNFNSSAVRQYRVMASRADDPLDIPCDLIVPADPGALAVCANLESSVNYSVRVAAEGFVIGAYSQPVFIVHKRNGKLPNKPASLALIRSAFLSFVLFSISNGQLVKELEENQHKRNVLIRGQFY